MKTHIVRLLWLLFALLFICGTVLNSGSFAVAQSNSKKSGILTHSNPRHFQCRSSVQAVITGNSPSLLLLELPIASTNPYQTVSNLQWTSTTNGEANAVKYPETNEQYAAALFRFPTAYAKHGSDPDFLAMNRLRKKRI